jgi:hypothetical protein
LFYLSLLPLGFAAYLILSGLSLTGQPLPVGGLLMSLALFSLLHSPPLNVLEQTNLNFE